MKRTLCVAAFVIAPLASLAQTKPDEILRDHILPRFEALAATTATLADVAQQDCAPTANTLRSAYHTAFDAWVSASHLRFGPTEVLDRAFALAFWPDSRGVTPRSLAALLAQEDPIALTADTYKDVSIAARGFYALEFLLYDATLSEAGDTAYHCTLVKTVTSDMATTSSAILLDWQDRYAKEVRNPRPNGVYRTEGEVLQELFKALSTGLQFTSDTRLGRPLGTYDRARPKRAEAHRSGRSAQHVLLTLSSLQELAVRLASPDVDLADRLRAQFETAANRLTALSDPAFAGVSDPQGRLKLEVVQQSVDAIRTIVTQDLGPALGVAAGFNSLDGD